MTLHISVRLPWHDLGWNGAVCASPEVNVFCGGLNSVNADHIRTHKDTAAEAACSGCAVPTRGGYLPPCTETINVFGPSPVPHVFTPQDFMRGTQPERREIPAYAGGTWPFERMWDDHGNPLPADERERTATEFFAALTPKESLVFYYCNYDNPLTADDHRYLLVGVSRLKEKLDPIYWTRMPALSAKMFGGYIWSRILVNDFPREGVRFPYQEYLRQGFSAEEVRRRAVTVSGDLARRFKYVSRHVGDDDATQLLEQALQAFRRFRDEGLVKGPEWDWDRQIAWLDDVLRETWAERGLFPGLASVLYVCGFPNPGIYVRDKARQIPGPAIRDYVFDRLADRVRPDASEEQAYRAARERWRGFTPELQRLCRECLPRFDLTEQQVGRILFDREPWGIVASPEAIFENPYRLCEEYLGESADDAIGFARIDHGMVPDPAAFTGSGVPEVAAAPVSTNPLPLALDDPRRLRALMVQLLGDAAAEGHSFLDRPDLIAQLHRHHSESGKVGRFLVDDATWVQHQEFFAEKLVLDQVQGLAAVFLARLYAAERKIRQEIVHLIAEEPLPQTGLHWATLLRRSLDPGQKPIPQAELEQAEALERVCRTRFAVLTGGAGTGKTTVLHALIQGLRQLDPGHSFLLLAPTGKAATVLTSKVQGQSPAATIHSFLRRQGWLRAKTWALRESGGKKVGPHTVIIDEASMLTTELLATTLRAINWHQVERLVLVGDPSQLPPIGAGKPFADIIDYLEGDPQRAERHLVRLGFNCRQEQGSWIIRLAEHYGRSAEIADEEVLWHVAAGRDQGDLAVRFWQSEAELDDLVVNVLDAALAGVPGATRTDRWDTLHRLQDFRAEPKLEAVQVLAPYYHGRSGVAYLNDALQKVLRDRHPSLKGFVRFDKVLQTVNTHCDAYDHEVRRKVDGVYVPNGALGCVRGVVTDRHGKPNLQVKFPPEWVRQSFYLTGKQVEESLELGYAVTVHKAQGSQFQSTIFILPAADSQFISRELLYTALTRASGKLYLLLQADSGLLRSRVWGGHSELIRRNSALFRTAKGLPADRQRSYRPDGLIESALPDLLVRSRGEAEIARALAGAEIPFYYEKPLLARDQQTFRIPDFTFSIRHREYYWEHLGMLGNPQYAADWERKRSWYTENGYGDRLLVTPLEGMSLAETIRHILCDRLGVELP